MSKQKVIILILTASFIALIFQLYKIGQVPACLNADEVAHSYNAYSLLKTAHDEYGHFMPLRLQSFLDFKLPLYAYLTIPFVAVLGLTDLATRMVNLIAGVA